MGLIPATKEGGGTDAQEAGTAPPKPLDAVLFYADDWRQDTLGAAGNPLVQVPVLDALGREAGGGTVDVSRATLLSGRYLTRHKLRCWGGGGRVEMLGRGRTVADGQKKEMGFKVPHDFWSSSRPFQGSAKQVTRLALDPRRP